MRKLKKKEKVTLIIVVIITILIGILSISYIIYKGNKNEELLIEKEEDYSSHEEENVEEERPQIEEEKNDNIEQPAVEEGKPVPEKPKLEQIEESKPVPEQPKPKPPEESKPIPPKPEPEPITGLSFEAFENKLIGLGWTHAIKTTYEYYSGESVDGMVRVTSQGVYFGIFNNSSSFGNVLKECFNLLLPTQGSNLYSIVNSNCSNDKLTMDGRTISIEVYPGEIQISITNI